MNKKQCRQLLFLIAFLVIIFPASQAQGKVHNFTSMRMEITVPEDTIIITKDLPNADELWAKAGITDPASEKKTFDDLGVQAILYDPASSTTVHLLQKQTAESKKAFHLSLLSKEELDDFLDNLINTGDENAKISISEYSHEETVFFRLYIETQVEEKEIAEIIYGTIINGYSITFDVFEYSSLEALNEDYIKELVAGTHFTEFLDKAEVEKQEQLFMLVSLLFFVLIVVILVLWIRSQKKKIRKQQAMTKLKTEGLSLFYKEMERRDANNIRDSILFSNRTRYSEEVIKDFYYYDRFFKRIKFWATSVILYIIILILLILNSESMIMSLIIIATPIIWVIMQEFQIEKLVRNITKNYSKGKSKEAIFMFYDDYYTMSGIQNISKYPYLLITDIREYKEFFYLYMGENHAIYLNKKGFEQDIEEFRKFILSKKQM